MLSLQAYSVALKGHQADVPRHIQANLPFTPLSSMQFLDSKCYIFYKKFILALSFYLILSTVVIYCHLQLNTMTVPFDFWYPVVFTATCFSLRNLRCNCVVCRKNFSFVCFASLILRMLIACAYPNSRTLKFSQFSINSKRTFSHFHS
jgi:hypothetical protein